jgi:hypothetical protein
MSTTTSYLVAKNKKFYLNNVLDDAALIQKACRTNLWSRNGATFISVGLCWLDDSPRLGSKSATGPWLLKHRYSGSSVVMNRRRLLLLWLLATTGVHTAYVICPSLLESKVVTIVLTSAHPLLLNRKHNLYLICKRRHNLKQNTISI